MTKSKTHKETDHLDGIIKQLKSHIRKLQKEIKYLRKREHISENIIEESNNPEEPRRVKVEMCPNCGKAEVIFFAIAGKGFKKCDICDWRSKSFAIKEEK